MHWNPGHFAPRPFLNTVLRESLQYDTYNTKHDNTKCSKSEQIRRPKQNDKTKQGKQKLSKKKQKQIAYLQYGVIYYNIVLLIPKGNKISE